MEEIHAPWMQRCLQLAAFGAGTVAPNPMVGAVLVCRDQIIGEGYHKRFGEAHAEVHCVESVPPPMRHLIPESTLYVSLEPCAHYGKTPPCTELIIAQGIPRVVIGCIDPFAAVSGRGVARLREAGVEVVTGVLEAACRELNRRFFTFHEKKRPYLILKWARSPDGYIALPGPKRAMISGAVANRLVHRWRGEEAGILIGSGTAAFDDPLLTNRLWSGPSPLRIVLDRSGRLSEDLQLFGDGSPTWVFTREKQGRRGKAEWISVFPPHRFLEEAMGILHERRILSVLVEGGAGVLEALVVAGLWDEARVITGRDYLYEGLREPVLTGARFLRETEVGGDRIAYFAHQG